MTSTTSSPSTTTKKEHPTSPLHFLVSSRQEKEGNMERMESSSSVHHTDELSQITSTCSNKIHVTFLCPFVDSSHFEAALPLSLTVSMIKEYLSHHHPSLPKPKDQKLIFRGRILADESILGELGLSSEDKEMLTMHLVVSGTTFDVLESKPLDILGNQTRSRSDSLGNFAIGHSVDTGSGNMAELSRYIMRHCPCPGQVFLYKERNFRYMIRHGQSLLEPVNAYVESESNLNAATANPPIPPLNQQVDEDAIRDNRLVEADSLGLLMKLLIFLLIFTQNAGASKIVFLIICSVLFYLKQTGRLNMQRLPSFPGLTGTLSTPPSPSADAEATQSESPALSANKVVDFLQKFKSMALTFALSLFPSMDSADIFVQEHD